MCQLSIMRSFEGRRRDSTPHQEAARVLTRYSSAIRPARTYGWLRVAGASPLAGAPTATVSILPPKIRFVWYTLLISANRSTTMDNNSGFAEGNIDVGGGALASGGAAFPPPSPRSGRGRRPRAFVQKQPRQRGGPLGRRLRQCAPRQNPTCCPW